MKHKNPPPPQLWRAGTKTRQFCKLSTICFCVFMFLFCFVFMFLHFNAPAFSQTSPDAIAIRVIPNPEYYSALRWYKEQGFSGSPQSLIVDGYEAIRDGRTVYVNAANVSSMGELYINIYLISYNQDPEQATIDIFGRILEHWHFNTNLTVSGNCVQEDSNLGDACLVDSDCKADEYCNSDKAKTNRDTRRLSDLAEIKIYLEDYKNKYNKYPTLESGSYIPYNSISTWPSWQGNLAQELGITIPIDPINKLGDCGEDRFDPITCWDQENKEFADSDFADPALNLPSFSYVYAYYSSGNGSSYGICGIMESGLVTTLGQGACEGSSQSIGISEIVENSQPEFTGTNLPEGYSGEEYIGYIEARDPDGDNLTWTLDISGETWPFWPAAPVMNNTAISSQKQIYAIQAGAAGDYIFTVSIDDGRGAANSVKTESFKISIKNPPPIITAQDITYTASTIIPLDYSGVTAKDYASNYPLTYSLSTSIPNNLTAAFSQLSGNDFYTFSLTGIFDPATEFFVNPSTDYNFTITITDLFGASASENFTITVLNSKPIITPAVLPDATGCFDYSFQVIASDPEGHYMEYFDNGTLPAGLSINQITGEITGQPQASGDYSFTIAVRDIYGAEEQETYSLTVTDENFAINPMNSDSIYVYPTGATLPLYFGPTQFNATAGVTTANPVTYSLQNNPLWLIIDSATGVIQGTPTDNINDPGSYNITVTATNYCGASASTGFTITVSANQWCGDGILQAGFGEECDNTALNGETCALLGFGNGTLQCDFNCVFDTSQCYCMFDISNFDNCIIQ